MSIGYTNHLNLNKLEIQNAVIQQLSTAPSSPVQGQYYYNTLDDKIYYYDGAAWVGVGTGTGSGDVTGQASSVDGEIALFSGTGGKTIKRATGTGLVKIAAGVLAVAAAGTDYLAPNGDGSQLTGLTQSQIASLTSDLAAKAPLASPALTGTPTAPTATAGTNTTQIATTAYVSSAVGAVLGANDAMVYKGAIDASTNPNYPAANAGDTYKISVAGKIGGASGIDVTVGDTIIATADGLSAGTQAAVGTSWTILQANVDRATSSTLGLAEYATSSEAEARTDSTVALTPASAANFPIKKIFTIGDGSAAQIDVTHNLGTKEIISEVRQASDDAVVECDKTNFSTSVVRLNFAVAPAINALKVVVMG